MAVAGKTKLTSHMLNTFKILSVVLATFMYAGTIGHAEIKDTEHIKDLNLIQGYFKKRFPDVPYEDFANGVYALDTIAKENWEALEEFPPYEIHIDTGEEYWQINSAIYNECFPDGRR